MFVGVLWLRTKRMKISNTVGVDVLGDPKINEFNFLNSYAQTLITKGFHQFYNCKSVRRGAPGTSPPYNVCALPFHICKQTDKSKFENPAEGIRGVLYV